jgi:ERCC4-type nuclease
MKIPPIIKKGTTLTPDGESSTKPELTPKHATTSVLLVVQLDDREKRPILFPSLYAVKNKTYSVQTEKVRMKAGDYRLKGDRFLDVGIERKGAVTELYDCFLGRDRGMATRQFEKMASTYARSVLLLESDPYDVMRYDYSHFTGGNRTTGDILLQQIARCSFEWGLHIVWTKRIDSNIRCLALGRLVLSLLTVDKTILRNSFAK